MDRSRMLVAGVVAIAGVGVATVLGLREAGPWQVAEARALTLVDPDPALLDTVRIRGRRVTASLSGTVQAVDPDGTVWLGDGGDAFPLAFRVPPDLRVEDRALAVGRLRGRGGRRWLDVDEWAEVEGGAR